jgi:hypothetical protein
MQADTAAMNAAFQGLLSRRLHDLAGTRSVVQRIPHTKISQLARSPSLFPTARRFKMLADYIGIFSFWNSDVTIVVKYYKSNFVTNYYTKIRKKNAAAWWSGRTSLARSECHRVQFAWRLRKAGISRTSSSEEACFAF